MVPAARHLPPVTRHLSLFLQTCLDLFRQHLQLDGAQNELVRAERKAIHAVLLAPYRRGEEHKRNTAQFGVSFNGSDEVVTVLFWGMCRSERIRSGGVCRASASACLTPSVVIMS